MSRDDFEDPRSDYGRVLESLNAVIHRHPSASRAARDADEGQAEALLPSNVVDLRARLATARSGGYPDDAA